MYDRILVPIDGSQTAEQGLREAIALARKLGSRLVALHVVDDFPLMMEWATAASFEDSLQRLRQYGNELLTQAAQAAAAEHVDCDTRLLDVRQETVANAILKEARGSGCGLIVMGTHGRRGMKRLAMGSDAELVVRSSTVPVLLLREPSPASTAST